MEVKRELYKYYFDQKALSRGSYPIENFDSIKEYEKMTYVNEINKHVLGEIRYCVPLPEDLATEYGLISSPSNISANLTEEDMRNEEEENKEEQNENEEKTEQENEELQVRRHGGR